MKLKNFKSWGGRLGAFPTELVPLIVKAWEDAGNCQAIKTPTYQNIDIKMMIRLHICIVQY